MDYECKVREELINNLLKLNDIIQERDSIEEELYDKYCDDYEEICEVHLNGGDPSVDEYFILCDQEMELISEIQRVGFDSKAHMVAGFTSEQIKDLSRYIKNAHDKDPYLKDKLENSLDIFWLGVKEGMKKRLNDLDNLQFKNEVNALLPGIYQELVSSYQYGNFRACVILCRAMVERVLKEALAKKLKEKDDYEEWYLKDLKKEAIKHELIDNKLKRIIGNIQDAGNKSVHAKFSINATRTLDIIEKTQIFIKEMSY